MPRSQSTDHHGCFPADCFAFMSDGQSLTCRHMGVTQHRHTGTLHSIPTIPLNPGMSNHRRKQCHASSWPDGDDVVSVTRKRQSVGWTVSLLLHSGCPRAHTYKLLFILAVKRCSQTAANCHVNFYCCIQIWWRQNCNKTSAFEVICLVSGTMVFWLAVQWSPG